MGKLTGQTIAASYDQLLIVDDANGISSSLQAIESADTGGSASSLKISTSKVEVIPASDSTSLFEVSQADGTAVLSVDTSNARVGIGTTSIVNVSGVGSKLQVSTADYEGISLLQYANDGKFPLMTIGKSRNATFGGNTILQDDDKVGGLLFVANDGTDFQSNIGRITAEVDDSSPAENEIGGRLVFSTSATDSGNVSERMRIDSAGDVTFTGDLIMADGKGIDFSADASPAAGMTAEILDDYEEGTWDAVVSDGTNPMTMDGSYDTGYYTKVGNLVTVSGYFVTTSLGSASGNIRITGLPFTVANNAAAYSGGAAGYGNGLDITAGHTVSIYGQTNDTYIHLQVWDATTGSSAMQASEWTADGQIMIGFSYRAA